MERLIKQLESMVEKSGEIIALNINIKDPGRRVTNYFYNSGKRGGIVIHKEEDLTKIFDDIRALPYTDDIVKVSGKVYFENVTYRADDVEDLKMHTGASHDLVDWVANEWYKTTPVTFIEDIPDSPNRMPTALAKRLFDIVKHLESKDVLPDHVMMASYVMSFQLKSTFGYKEGDTFSTQFHTFGINYRELLIMHQFNVFGNEGLMKVTGIVYENHDPEPNLAMVECANFDESKGLEITFLTGTTDVKVELTKEMIKDLEAKYPDIKFHLK